ncbi:Formamidopyrimidine-DNA glycosylase [Geobacillus stearothermophilus]|uniref:Formamidopyrimidine-DNA glycosylase n=1 Tax=Geobacillus stearothermophilus TaxID=1422 RepID=A0ABQ7HE08_GEOSE|nr:DNA-formamidopyrimidine glycosylase [Geobacillus stearothermophilus]KAF6510449.1 Formamidopyrimidine-DNA glycosylase [Geobacillus stearothermophilus]
MPELPEVETIRRTLLPLVAGKTIEEVRVFWPNIIRHPQDPAAFAARLAGQTVRGIDRRGKFLKFLLDRDMLISHLRMEGRYAVAQSDEPLEPHTHIVFRFTDGSELRYRDVRKFGTMHVYAKEEADCRPPLAQLGPEPLSPAFSPAVLAAKAAKTKRTVKALLLDQTVVAGFGNIYVDEALFRAGILPGRPAASLTDEELARLHEEMVATIGEAVMKGGSTVRTYVNTQGEAGMFQHHLFVYGRKGEPCKRCGTPIEKIVVAGRGTHYCPRCQR